MAGKKMAKTLKQKINAWKKAADTEFARELALTAENESSLYNQRLSIEKNLVNKRAAGKYDHDKATVLWGYWMDSAGKKYAKDFGVQADKATRMMAAREVADEFRAAMKTGEYDYHLHKKHQKRRNPVVHAPLKSHYSYDVRGPQGGRYMTTTEAEAKKLTRNGGSYRRIKKFGQKWDATVHRRHHATNLQEGHARNPHRSGKNPRKDYSPVITKINTANRWAGKYNRAVAEALDEYGDGTGQAISGVVRDHFPRPVKDELRKLLHGFQRAQDAVGAAWHEIHPRTDFYRAEKAASFRDKMRKAGYYGTGTRTHYHRRAKNPRGHLPVDSAGEGIAFRHKYLDMFFAEKDLPIKTWTIEAPDGTSHIINSNVVLEHLAQAPKSEKDQIADIIRKIDFANGDVNHLLHHLAGAIAANYGQ